MKELYWKAEKKSEMREEILMKRLQNGDVSVLDELIGMYYPEILRYCIWHAPDSAMAEDAAQETFLKAVKYIGSCGFSGKFRAFLYKIAANTCTDMKKNKWNKHAALDMLPEEPVYTETEYARVEEDMVIRSLVRKLEPKQQEILLLRFRQNLKLREIAEIVGLPMRTVQSKLKTGLKEVERELKKEEKKTEGGAGR